MIKIKIRMIKIKKRLGTSLVFLVEERPFCILPLAYFAALWIDLSPKVHAQSSALPIISRQASHQIAGVGGQATFSVQVGVSSTPLSYQWRFNGTNLLGATNALLALTNVQTRHAGSYSVVVRNLAGAVTNPPVSLTVPYLFTTFAGSTPFGSADRAGKDAQFNFPSAVAVDSATNIYVADTGNHTIRKITRHGTNTDWVVSTLAGKAGSPGIAEGAGGAARFNSPNGIAVDNVGNIYVADTGNHTIRKVTAAGVVGTLAGLAGSFGSTDGIGDNARFNSPNGVAVDGTGNVYVADSENHTIRKITSTGVVSTLAGQTSSSGSADGPSSQAQFNFPCGIAVDKTNNLFVADTYNHTIRQIAPGGIVTTFAGLARAGGTNDATGAAARFNNPRGVAVNNAGNVYVADTSNYYIRKITPAGVVSTLPPLGTLGPGFFPPANGGLLNFPSGVAVDSAGDVYVADSGNGAIHRITVAAEAVTLAGPPYLYPISGSADGTVANAQFNFPCEPILDKAGNIYVADFFNHTIRKITPAGIVTTVAGQAGKPGIADGAGTNASFNSPTSVTLDSLGHLYVSDGANHTIRKITPEGAVSTLAGQPMLAGSDDGIGANAQFNFTAAVAVDRAGILYVADQLNNTIRKITPDKTGTNWAVTTLAGVAGIAGGKDGAGLFATFNFPNGVVVDEAGNVYVADYYNHTIRKITPAGVVSTLAGKAGVEGFTDGQGSDARFSYPWSVGLDSAGNLYVPDSGNNTMRKITADGWVSTLAGRVGFAGATDGIGSNALFNVPTGPVGNNNNADTLFVAEAGSNLIRRGVPATAPIVTAQPQSQTVVAGANVTFAVAASDATPVSYQWQFNGLSLPGATNRTLIVSNVQASQAGQYVVVVTSATGVTSPAAMLTVESPSPIRLAVLPMGQPPLFQLRLTAPAGQSVVLQASTNLTNWLPLLTNTMINGTFDFTEPDTAKFKQRFYRGLKP